MQSISTQPYAKRPVPTPAGQSGNLKAWADRLAAWLGVEFANVQRGTIRASSKTVTAAYTALNTDGLILADATGGAFTVTLPAPATVHDMMVTIKRLNGGGNAVTIGGTVDGTLNRTLASQYATMTVWADISADPAGAWYRVSII